MRTIAKGESNGRITGFTKLSNTTAIEATRLITPAMSFANSVSDAGILIIGGGTRTNGAGIQIGIGTTTIIATTVIMTTTVSNS